ncbi:MAG: NADH:flavin oxidoreductase, partial [Clostridiales bacterium]|nr:NADH:flavin oxidoreductase [Clostridiales bacterium]
ANQADYARLVGECRVSGALQILQLTHSGRYSRPSGRPTPIVPQRDPLLDPRVGITGDWEIASDAYLESLIEKYAKSAKLAEEAGFDGVDIKACHRYLLSELLASHERTGKYGGSLENRARLLLEIAKAVRDSTGSGFIVACRFNVFDNHPYPYGFGMGKDGTFDSSEPIKLTRMLCDSGFDLLAVSAGNPYYLHPQTGRPFDSPPEGIPVPNEHPLESASRLFSLAQLVAKEAGNVPVIGCGYSWLRQYLPLVGSANLERGGCSFVGLGRSSLAYPDAPKDILEGRGMSPEKCCIACSKCTQLMRDHERAGCVARDSRVYGPIYKQGREAATSGKST